MILQHLSLDQCGWLSRDNGGDPDVLSSRVRLARNLIDVPFSSWADTASLVRVREQVTAALHEILKAAPDLPDFEFLVLDELPDLDREFLAERNLISNEMARSALPRSVAISADETVSIMINEEDHIRMQCLRPGRNLSEAWAVIDRIDDLLSERLDYAFSPRWGYLTACPTNVGTGIRCSVMLHLPALVLSRQVEPVLKAIQRNGLEIRGLGGEGSDITGNIFQISNRMTLGISEQETLDTVAEAMQQLLEVESKTKQQLLAEARTAVMDNVWRAYGLLATAHSISTEEARRLVSSVRLGISTGLLDRVPVRAANEVLFCTGAAHLQKMAGNELEEEDRDIRRAEFIRERISLN